MAKKVRQKVKDQQYKFQEQFYVLTNFQLKKQPDFEMVRKQFIHTKNYNKTRKNSGASRNTGLPDEFGEGIYRLHRPECLSFKSSSGKKGDMFDSTSMELVEVKVITSKAPTSFGPVVQSERFVIIVLNWKSEYEVYEISYSQLRNAQIASGITIGEQWDVNKKLKEQKQRAPRPRLSLNKYISDSGMTPSYKGRIFDEEELNELEEIHNKHIRETDEICKKSLHFSQALEESATDLNRQDSK